VSSLERRCRRLLRAYPAWYRRERAEEMLGTLLEASPPGRGWPSFRDTRALITGGLRVRGWTWLLSMVWVAANVVLTGYTFYITTQPYDPDLGIPGWSTDPLAVQIAIVLAIVASDALPVPLLVAGFIRLRGWRRGNWLRAAAWAGACIAGAALLALSIVWGDYPCGPQGLSCPSGSPAIVSWGELAICPAWLVLGAVVTWILARPARRSYVPDPASRASHEASRWPPGAGDLQT
jgi:hypothetical protein